MSRGCTASRPGPTRSAPRKQPSSSAGTRSPGCSGAGGWIPRSAKRTRCTTSARACTRCATTRYLAERAAVDATDTIDEVVTFQAGGIDREHADEFERNRGDIRVRHHSSDQDFVHLAGEARLAGDTFHHHSDDGRFGHIYSLMAGVDGEVLSDAGVDEGTTAGWDDQDRQLLEFGRRGVATARHALGATFDPAYYMAEDALAGVDSLEGHADVALDMARSGGSEALEHTEEAAARAFRAGRSGDGTAMLDALSAGGSAVVDDLSATGGALWGEATGTFDELSAGASHSLHRAGARASEQAGMYMEDVRSETETGDRILHEGLLRAGQWEDAGLEAAGETGRALWEAGTDTAGSVVDSASSVVDAAASTWRSLWD